MLKILLFKGVHFPYIGNVTGHDYENTYCLNCSKTLIIRFGFQIVSYRITKNRKYTSCGEEIPITRALLKKLTQIIWKHK